MPNLTYMFIGSSSKEELELATSFEFWLGELLLIIAIFCNANYCNFLLFPCELCH